MKSNDQTSLNIDLSNLQLEDVNVLFEQASQGMPAFAASSGTYCCGAGACSCSADLE